MRTIPAVLLGCMALAGCAQYEARPLSADAVVLGLQQRTLDAAPLQQYLRTHLQRTAPPWDLDALTVAAWFYSPELDQARARYETEAAAVITAAQPPAPSLAIPFEYNTTAKDGESPYTIGLGLDIPIETAGKRGFRTAHARALSLAAQLDIRTTAWRVRQQLRRQLLAYWDAGARLRLLHEQLTLRERLLGMLERRQALGEAASPELDTVRAEAASDRVQLLRAGRDEADALAAAAGVIGVPAAALREHPPALRNFDTPPREPERGAAAEAALRNRADVQAGLARYEASQSALQLAVANQYPDIHLGPGYTFDAGAHKIVFNLTGITLPLPRDNRGAIAEATAQRRLAAAQVQATIATAMGDVARAFAGWASAGASLVSARQAVAAQERLVHAAADALRVGEADRPQLLRSELGATTARLEEQQALLDLQKVAGATEDAVQRPALGDPGGAEVRKERP